MAGPIYMSSYLSDTTLAFIIHILYEDRTFKSDLWRAGLASRRESVSSLLIQLYRVVTSDHHRRTPAVLPELASIA